MHVYVVLDGSVYRAPSWGSVADYLPRCIKSIKSEANWRRDQYRTKPQTSIDVIDISSRLAHCNKMKISSIKL